jgi:GMP synthase-like glutamine amidotransferase
MHIAVLVTNTDDSAFAARHPSDGQKFRDLISTLRPGWQLTAFDLPLGEFPADMSVYDGFIIGGSPASVNDDAPWIARLMQAVPQIVALGKPLFGACFGHQAVAVALGGKVTGNPGGWVFGVTETQITHPPVWMEPGLIRLNAAHSEQVTQVPPGAEVLGSNADCAVGFLRLGNKVFTTQYHPEITHGFMAALVEEYAHDVPPEVAATARQSLAHPADADRMAGWIIGFFEQA